MVDKKPRRRWQQKKYFEDDEQRRTRDTKQTQNGEKRVLRGSPRRLLDFGCVKGLIRSTLPTFQLLEAVSSQGVEYRDLMLRVYDRRKGLDQRDRDGF